MDVVLGQQVSENQQIASARIILAGGNQQIVPMRAPVDGYVYALNVVVGQSIDSRLFAWMNIVEEEERFTNVMEYKANDRDRTASLMDVVRTLSTPIRTTTGSSTALKSWVGKSSS